MTIWRTLGTKAIAVALLAAAKRQNAKSVADEKDSPSPAGDPAQAPKHAPIRRR